MRPVEGYLIESVEGIIFDVKGLIHPPGRVIAFPRFIPSVKGTRCREETRYRKIYSLKERFEFLDKNLPEYIVYDHVFGTKMCEVPLERMKKIYNPVEGLRELYRKNSLESLESTALKCLEILQKEANVPWSSLGISGSILVGIYSESSDIDPVVYGVENCLKVHSALHKLLNQGDTLFKPYSLKELRELYDFRSKDTFMDFMDFAAVESRKVFQGKFAGRDFFIRFVKDPSEIREQYGDVVYHDAGYVKIEANVLDDSEAIFTPCTYKLEDVKVVEGPNLYPIREIASFRGRFCEQARKNERIIAQGKIEHVENRRTGEDYYRILLGNMPQDYMILKT